MERPENEPREARSIGARSTDLQARLAAGRASSMSFADSVARASSRGIAERAPMQNRREAAC